MGDIVYTIGYGGRKPEELVKILKEHGVDLVVDVRRKPKGYLAVYSYPQIKGWLAKHGIDYLHEARLGNPYETVEEYEADAENLLGKLDLMGMLKEWGYPERTVALLCAEKNPERCHRRVIADWLAKFGVKIAHLSSGLVGIRVGTPWPSKKFKMPIFSSR